LSIGLITIFCTFWSGVLSEDQCGITCMTRAGQQLSAMAGQIQTDPTSLIKMAKPQFQSFCKTIVETISCLDKCSTTQVTAIFIKTMAAGRYVCKDHYDEFDKNYDCMQKAQSTIKVQCENDKCKALNQAPIQIAQQSQALGEKKRFYGVVEAFW